jgi:puromycin-sensitive aminopeptidase
VQVFTPPGRGQSGRFALDVAVRTLDLYDDFFRVPYPLPKLDMIAIMDFAMVRRRAHFVVVFCLL